MFEGDNYRKPIVHHLIEYAAQNYWIWQKLHKIARDFTCSEKITIL
jgi:hypothetical protein